jgi:hypothetical protein
MGVVDFVTWVDFWWWCDFCNSVLVFYTCVEDFATTVDDYVNRVVVF